VSIFGETEAFAILLCHERIASILLLVHDDVYTYGCCNCYCREDLAINSHSCLYM
jgi:hypothetical protein